MVRSHAELSRKTKTTDNTNTISDPPARGRWTIVTIVRSAPGRDPMARGWHRVVRLTGDRAGRSRFSHCFKAARPIHGAGAASIQSTVLGQRLAVVSACSDSLRK